MSEYFETAMCQISEEFAGCIKVHRDHTLTAYDSSSMELIHSKLVRVVLIQNFDQNVKHAAIIAEDVGPEFVEYPNLVQREVDKISDSVFVGSSHAFISGLGNDSASLVFSNAVYLYFENVIDYHDKIQRIFEDHGLKLFIRDSGYWEQREAAKQPDVFICHDSRDKESFVRPLAQALSRRILKVWYDEYSLKIGDSLVTKIDEGLKECRYGVVVISNNFLTRKKWTSREFRSLTSKEIDSDRKVILPIWLNVSKEQVAEYSLDLADKIALNANEGIEKIADKIKAEVRIAT